MRETIFQRFEQVPLATGTNQPRPEGAGLGLPIAREIAQLMGGTLICSGPPAGSPSGDSASWMSLLNALPKVPLLS
jgi:signal transduction histidine kinase